MNSFDKRLLPAFAMVVLAACGGGGESTPAQAPPPPSGPVSVLAWDPPANYADNAFMDPYRDLDYYELYVRTDGNFAETDLPVALGPPEIRTPERV